MRISPFSRLYNRMTDFPCMRSFHLPGLLGVGAFIFFNFLMRLNGGRSDAERDCGSDGRKS